MYIIRLERCADAEMKTIIFEGLPLIGKSTLIEYIKSLKIKNVHCVEEIILKTKELDQESFMKNDVAKVKKYKNGLVFIDKAFISTLSYNEMLDYLIGNNELLKVKEWFQKVAIPFYQKDDVITIYLRKAKKEIRIKNEKSPHGSVKNQIMMEKIEIKNIKKYCKNYKIITYYKKDMEKVVNEIINKYM